MLEIYYNSLQYRNTMHAAEALFARPIELYEALADYYKEESLWREIVFPYAADRDSARIFAQGSEKAECFSGEVF